MRLEPLRLADERLARSMSRPPHCGPRASEMGADLYIKSLFVAAVSRIDPMLQIAQIQRDASLPNSAEHTIAQSKVDDLLGEVYCVTSGYFRDPYNSDSLLGQLGGVSWWQEIGPRLDAEDRLSTADVWWLRELVRTRRITFQNHLTEEQEIAAECLGVEDRPADAAPRSRYSAEDVEWFVSRKLCLMAFLEEALRLNESIVCSL